MIFESYRVLGANRLDLQSVLGVEVIAQQVWEKGIVEHGLVSEFISTRSIRPNAAIFFGLSLTAGVLEEILEYRERHDGWRELEG